MKVICSILFAGFVFSCSSPDNKENHLTDEDPSTVGLDWISVEPGNDGYKILFPQQPKEHEQRFSTVLGELKMTSWEFKPTAEMKDDNEQYSFSYADYPFDVMKNATRNYVHDLLENARERLAIDLRGDSLLSLTYPEDKKYYTGEQIRVDLDGGKKISILQYFFIKNRLYVLGAITTADKSDNPRLRKFMESFRLPTGKTLSEIMVDRNYAFFLINEGFKMGGGGNLRQYYSQVLDFDFNMTSKEFDYRSQYLAGNNVIKYDAGSQRYYYTFGDTENNAVKCFIIPSFLNDTLYQVKLLAKDDDRTAQNKDTSSSLGKLLIHLVDKEGLPTMRFNMSNVGDMYVWFELHEHGNRGYNDIITHQALYLYKSTEGTIATYTELTKVKYMDRVSLIRPETGPL